MYLSSTSIHFLFIMLKEVHAHDKEFSVAIDLLSMLGEATALQNGHEFVRLANSLFFFNEFYLII